VSMSDVGIGFPTITVASNVLVRRYVFITPIRIVFISWCSLFINSLTIILFREGINQILVGINSSPIAVLVQFSGRLLISVVGSKIENRFLITFRLFC